MYVFIMHQYAIEILSVENHMHSLAIFKFK